MRSLFQLLMGACLMLALVPARADEPPTQTGGITQISVQRTECYGDCPIDTLTLGSDGSATYSGFRSVPRRGPSTGTLSKERFAGLTRFLQDQNFFELRPQIGQGNIDAPDFLVSVTRDRLPYSVAFRMGGNPALQERMKKALLIADEITWTRDEEASTSGVNGRLQRPLTTREARLFQDRPQVKSFPMQFALVELESLDRPGERVETRSDQEGRFEFFARPGRYSVQARNSNKQNNYRPDEPVYDSPSQVVEVKAKTFAQSSLSFKVIVLPRR